MTRKAETVGGRRRVLLVDDDRDVADLVRAVLTDQGYPVSVLFDANPARLREVVDLLEPVCVLLDGEVGRGDEESRAAAAALRARARPIPVVKLAVAQTAGDESAVGPGRPSRAAEFAAVLPKPFDLHDLVATIDDCAGGGCQTPSRRGRAPSSGHSER